MEDPFPPEFETIFFGFNLARIDPRERSTVALDANVLRRHPGLRVVIEGHCDDRGSERYNFGLGLRRANAVARAIEAAGIASRRLQIVSLGKDAPLDIGHRRSDRAVNRSVVIREP